MADKAKISLVDGEPPPAGLVDTTGSWDSAGKAYSYTMTFEDGSILNGKIHNL